MPTKQSQSDEMATIASMAELAALVKRWGTLHVRSSEGPEADAAEPARDPESGLELPGLPARPLCPPEWWTLPLEDWLARELRSRETIGPVATWVLVGTDMGCDADGAPLLGHVRPMGWLSPEVLAEAAEHHRRRFGAEHSASVA